MARLILKSPYIKGGTRAGNHAKYIATRERVERLGSHGLFDDEGDHPHVHTMAWSAGDAPGYLSPVGIQDIKSALTNDIFQQEMLHVYEQKSQSRDELVQEARRTMLELAREMKRMMRSRPVRYTGSSGQ